MTLRSPRPSTGLGPVLLAAVVGGLVVLAVGGTLIGTGLINTGNERREIVREVRTPVATQALGKGSRGLSIHDIYRRDGPGVVFVQARIVQPSDLPFGPPSEQGTATGSGFVLDKGGHVLTNAHVVEGASDVGVRFEEGGDLHGAKVVGRDVSTDIAVLKVAASTRDLHPLRLGDSSKVRVGDVAIAIGNPFGFSRTVTTGIVSALQRKIQAPNGFTIEHVIQTDAAVNPGNSGGPLLNSRGEVIGINSQIATPGTRGSVGIGFAVPSNTARKVVPQLETKGQVEHAYIGIESAPVTRRIAGDLNLPTNHGALVQRVVPGSPAQKAGLRAGKTQTDAGLVIGGDLIIKVGGADVSGPDDVAAAIADRKPGEKVEIEYYRGGSRKSATLTLGKRPPGFGQEAQPSPDTLPLP